MRVPIDTTSMSENTSFDHITAYSHAAAAGGVQSTISLLVSDFEPQLPTTTTTVICDPVMNRKREHHMHGNFHDRTWFQRKLWICNPIVSLLVQHF